MTEPSSSSAAGAALVRLLGGHLANVGSMRSLPGREVQVTRASLCWPAEAGRSKLCLSFRALWRVTPLLPHPTACRAAMLNFPLASYIEAGEFTEAQLDAIDARVMAGKPAPGQNGWVGAGVSVGARMRARRVWAWQVGKRPVLPSVQQAGWRASRP